MKVNLEALTHFTDQTPPTKMIIVPDDDSNKDGCQHDLQARATVPSAVLPAWTRGVHRWPTHGCATDEKDPEDVQQYQDGDDEDLATEDSLVRTSTAMRIWG